MMDFLKGALSEESKELLIQQEYIKQAQKFHGARSLAFISDYYEDRHLKQAYILENIYAQGFETEDFLKVLAKAKGLGPNIDFFTLGEIKKLGQKFVEDQMEKLKNQGSAAADNATSASNFFEDNLRKIEEGTISKKMSRRPTKRIEGTILNRQQNIVAIVQNGQQIILNQVMSYIQNSTMQMDIITYPFKWRVKRNHNEFVALREYLLRKFPQTIVPPLPRVNPKKRLTARQLLKRQNYYQRFLRCVLKSMVLRSSEFLVEFLKETNSESFKLKLLGASMEAGPKKINEIMTMGGEIDVQARKAASAFCDNFSTYIDTYSEINQFIAQKVKSIQCKSHELADEIFSVGAEIQRFSALLKSTDVPQLFLLYERLSNIMMRNGDFILQSGEVLNTQLNGWFKFHREEASALRESQNLRDESKMKFEQRYQTLMKQKEKLFRKQDVLAWRVNTEDQVAAERVKNDPSRAYQYILPDTTKEVELLKEEAEYFTNQTFREVKRFAMQDYELARENFVNMGEMMLRLIYQMNIGWQEFLSYYTELNVARKQYDEKFQQERCIGEEIEDPMNSDSDEEKKRSDPYGDQALPPRSRLTEAYARINESERHTVRDDDTQKLLDDEERNGNVVQIIEEERKEEV